MIVDTSAIIAILRAEPERAAFVVAVDRASVVRISAATYVEVGIVLDRARQPIIARRLDELLGVFGCIIEPLTQEQARTARAAHQDYGRGSGHPARLNYGDCFSYALAKATGEPLLYKGDDFVHTDVRPAVTPG